MTKILAALLLLPACLSVPKSQPDGGAPDPDADLHAPDADPLAPDAALNSADASPTIEALLARLGEYSITWSMDGGSCADPFFAANKVLIEWPDHNYSELTITWENDCGAPAPVTHGYMNEFDKILIGDDLVSLESCDGKWIDKFTASSDVEFYFGPDNTTTFYWFPITTERVYFTNYDNVVCDGSYRIDGAHL